MPEVREVLSSFLMMVIIFAKLLLPTGITIVDLWYDRKNASDPWDIRSATGCVGILRPAGANTPNRQGADLWPKHLTPAQLRTLRLVDVNWNHRCVYLKFADATGSPTWLSVRTVDCSVKVLFRNAHVPFVPIRSISIPMQTCRHIRASSGIIALQ